MVPAFVTASCTWPDALMAAGVILYSLTVTAIGADVAEGDESDFAETATIAVVANRNATTAVRAAKTVRKLRLWGDDGWDDIE